MKYRFKGSIFFKDKNNKELYFQDIYSFSSESFDLKYDFDYIKEYISYDLRLVAGGGYTPAPKEKTRIFIYQV